jgi:hypothetical protein
VLSLVLSAVFPLVITAAESLRSPELASLEIAAMADWVSAQMNDRGFVGCIAMLSLVIAAVWKPQRCH